MSPAVEGAVEAAGIPNTFVGVIVALLVLLPEGLAGGEGGGAQPAADEPQPRNRLGDGDDRPDDPGHRGRVDLAARPLTLGLGPVQIVLFVLTVLVSILTIAPGREHAPQGAVHLVLFAAFIFLAINP